ncbi:unnamed protein product [Mycetohabitans rhizoxinica HKI 454]|uniref:Uncharacterized protein n=1 Tax=Mycetohabitans rhizoxinica (strain DSM 19002 / CIP 109453 / HKI 454) TaxID=882378 RepID=E5ARB5_MYCRK|nr:unnamed protein product [Mycetohabitans rhizoxinica HKI 454]
MASIASSGTDLPASSVAVSRMAGALSVCKPSPSVGAAGRCVSAGVSLPPKRCYAMRRYFGQ